MGQHGSLVRADAHAVVPQTAVPFLCARAAWGTVEHAVEHTAEKSVRSALEHAAGPQAWGRAGERA